MPATAKPKVEVEEPSAGIARRTFISLLVTVGFILLFAFLYLIRSVIIQVVIATVVAMALAPMVDWLVRRGFRRGLACLTVLFVTVVAILAVVGAVITPLVSETTRFIHSLPDFVANLNQNHAFQDFDNQFHVVEKAQELSATLPSKIFGLGGDVASAAGAAINLVTTFFVVLTLTFFLLLEGPSVWKQFVTMLSPRSGTRVNSVGTKIAKAVGGYVTGNLLISVVAGAVAYLAMTILGIPFAVPLAIFVALFDLIPMVGATIATILVALVALSESALDAVLIVIIMIIYQQIEGNVLQPMIYSRTVNLSALWILIASLVGATLGGVIGILLAIPAASAVQIVAIELLSGTETGRRAHISQAGGIVSTGRLGRSKKTAGRNRR